MKEVCLEYVHLSIFFSSSFFLFWPVWKPEVDVFLLVDTDFLGVFIRDFFVFIAEHLEFSETFYPFLLIFTFLPVSYILQEKTGRGG